MAKEHEVVVLPTPPYCKANVSDNLVMFPGVHLSTAENPPQALLINDVLQRWLW